MPWFSANRHYIPGSPLITVNCSLMTVGRMNGTDDKDIPCKAKSGLGKPAAGTLRGEENYELRIMNEEAREYLLMGIVWGL